MYNLRLKLFSVVGFFLHRKNFLEKKAVFTKKLKENIDPKKLSKNTTLDRNTTLKLKGINTGKPKALPFWTSTNEYTKGTKIL